jgi:hypothetical protein
MLWEIDKEELLRGPPHVPGTGSRGRKGRSPCGLEFSFGYRGRSGEPIALVLGDGSSISFRGRIDRVDSSPDGTSLRVVDYKTGKLSGKEDGCGGTTLQLPLPPGRVQDLKDSVVEKSWAEYQSVSRKGVSSVSCFEEGWEEKESALKGILETISGDRGGTFSHSGGPEGLRILRFQDRLRVRRRRSLREKKNDPGGGFYQDEGNRIRQRQ